MHESNWMKRIANYFRPPSGQAEEFLKEQRAIAHELDRLLSSYGARLADLANRIRGMDDQMPMAERRNLREEQNTLRRVIRRAEAAELDRRALMDEWNQWRMQDDATRTPAQSERQEIIRSELAVRGIRLPETGSNRGWKEEGTEERVPVTVSGRPLKIERQAPDDFEEWDETIGTHASNAVEFLEDEIRALLEAGANDPVQAAEMLKQFRQAQGDLRLIDRARGTRRFRLGAFLDEEPGLVDEG